MTTMVKRYRHQIGRRGSLKYSDLSMILRTSSFTFKCKHQSVACIQITRTVASDQISLVTRENKMKTTYKLKNPPASTPALYATEDIPNDEKLVIAHYFLPGTGADWYILEFSPEERLLFGWAELVPGSGSGELGYTSLRELESLVVFLNLGFGNRLIPFPFRVELDEHWTIRPLCEVLAERA